MLAVDTLDITDEQLYVQRGYPFAEWDLMRREAPVYWYQRPGYEPFWALTRHEDISWVARNPQIFSSSQRVMIDTCDGVESVEWEREQRAAMFGHAVDDPPSISWMDPPQHRQLRQIMSPCFTPRAMAQIDQQVHDLAREYVGEFTAKLDHNGIADVAADLSAKLPVAAICNLLGVPREDWDRVFQWTEGTIGAADPDHQDEGQDAATTFQRNITELNEYVAGLVQERMAAVDPDATDVLSRLVNARIEDEPLKFHEILYAVLNLLYAGNSTTRNATAGGIQALLEHPDELNRLNANSSLLPTAVEEVLRWTSIAIQFARTATEDTELGGQRIRKGETVCMLLPAANRDPEVFPDPYRFDVGRKPNSHFAFSGFGPHVCLGANMARLEIRAMLRAVLPVLPTLELVGKPTVFAHHLQVGEIKRLMVRRRN